jgi:hypothetical protein
MDAMPGPLIVCADALAQLDLAPACVSVDPDPIRGLQILDSSVAPRVADGMRPVLAAYPSWRSAAGNSVGPPNSGT